MRDHLMNKLARAGFHTNYLDHCARLYHGPTLSGLSRSFGSGAVTNSIADIAQSDCIFVIGRIPWNSTDNEEKSNYDSTLDCVYYR